MFPWEKGYQQYQGSSQSYQIPTYDHNGYHIPMLAQPQGREHHLGHSSQGNDFNPSLDQQGQPGMSYGHHLDPYQQHYPNPIQQHSPEPYLYYDGSSHVYHPKKDEEYSLSKFLQRPWAHFYYWFPRNPQQPRDARDGPTPLTHHKLYTRSWWEQGSSGALRT